MTKKIEFVNILRGVASVIVAILAHYGTVFFINKDAVATLIQAPAISHGPVPYVFGKLYDLGFSAGAFGVAIFFLISGFVIPFSFLHYTKMQFIIGRLFRILPTYIAGLIVTLLALKVSTTYWNTAWPYTFQHILLQMTLLRDIMWLPTIDGISWTLEIEMKFYLMSAFILSTIYTKMKYSYIILIPIIGFIILVGSGELYNDNTTRAYQLVYVIHMSIIFITFILIGVLLNFHHRNGISSTKLVTGIIFLFILFTLDWKFSILYSFNFISITNYFMALFIFAVMYIFRFAIKSNKILDFFANISYTLYVTHAIVGYTIMQIFLVYYSDYKTIAITIACSVSILIAYILHITVEKSSMMLNKKIIKGIYK